MNNPKMANQIMINANKINCIVKAKQHPCRKISTWVLIIFSGFVYSKSAIFKAIQNPVHKHRAILYRKIGQATPASVRQGVAPISGIRKGGKTDNRFLKRRCYDNREIDHTVASRGGPENPRTTRVKRFPTGNRLTVGAIHPQSRCRGPFSPGIQPGKTGTGTEQRWKRNHLKKCACLNTLRFEFALKHPFLSSAGRQVNGRA